MRRIARIDTNHTKLVKQLRQCGYSVLNTHQLKNCFDILVGHNGKNYAFEIKDPDKPPSSRKLTEGEQKFFDTWKGNVNVIHTLDEAIKIIEKGEKK